MALIQKTDPIGVDKVIDGLQEYLFNELNLSLWQSYPRAYKNPNHFNDQVFIPEVFIDGEYYEAFYDDDYNLTSYFVVDDERNFDGGVYTTEIALIIQANVETLLPSIPHRADEELLNLICREIQYYPGEGIDLLGVETSVLAVYREFTSERLTFNDMNEFFVARINMNATYYTDCCANC